MKLQVIDGGLVIHQGQDQKLSTENFADKNITVQLEPAFYVALGADGLMVRSVSVTLEDRKTVAALVGNWIAEGFQPIPCDIKAFAKHVRVLAAANKPAPKVEVTGAAAGDTGGATAGGDASAGASTDNGAAAGGDAAAGDAAAGAAAGGDGI
jgi:hypothetical protein